MSQSNPGIAACALLLALAACGGDPRPAPAPKPVDPPAPAAPVAPPEIVDVAVGRIAPRQTLTTALGELGLRSDQVFEIIESLKGVFDFRKSRVGDQIRLTKREGRVDVMEYRSSPTDEWIVQRQDGKLVAARRTIDVETRVEYVSLAIDTSLYESMVAAGEDPGFAVDLADVFAWDVDFYRDVRRGDRLRAVVEKQYAHGRLLRYGAILGARYQGEVVGDKRLLRYATASGETSYFDEQGNSAKKSFLKSPLKYVHITSRYGGRRHPMLGYVHQHQGVDFAAAVGTPVWSVADGVVTRAVKGDPRAGNYVFVKHINGFETGYLHLSRFAEGVHAGARVRQKQVIAYSGNTGTSTGPHLHYAMKRGGQYVNPLAQKFPRAEPLPRAELPQFQDSTRAVAQMLDAEVVASSAPAPAPAAATPAESAAPEGATRL